jgi:hypothetical protein
MRAEKLVIEGNEDSRGEKLCLEQSVPVLNQKRTRKIAQSLQKLCDDSVRQKVLRAEIESEWTTAVTFDFR